MSEGLHPNERDEAIKGIIRRAALGATAFLGIFGAVGTGILTSASVDALHKQDPEMISAKARLGGSIAAIGMLGSWLAAEAWWRRTDEIESKAIRATKIPDA